MIDKYQNNLQRVTDKIRKYKISETNYENDYYYKYLIYKMKYLSTVIENLRKKECYQKCNLKL